MYLLSAIKSLNAENAELKAQQLDTQTKLAELTKMVNTLVVIQGSPTGSSSGSTGKN
jgi:hypothetical protein